ncbi:hypothetical protein [uncultured Desulfobacter sp.]|uniref:hypothetical protein n=1 Tax=uncultured Desulfobacter sp. TaxID=240139 RepID=UPI0029F45C86|nr:hypothetical protein [uncultured Desulfobacter sp.]
MQKKFYIPGCVWHITHRCHKKEFLLKFARDRNRWLDLLFRAKQKYGLEVLNYIVTSNHILLLVSDNGNRDTLQKHDKTGRALGDNGFISYLEAETGWVLKK